MLPLLLFNVISSLVVDKATDLATEHVEYFERVFSTK